MLGLPAAGSRTEEHIYRNQKTYDSFHNRSFQQNKGRTGKAVLSPLVIAIDFRRIYIRILMAGFLSETLDLEYNQLCCGSVFSFVCHKGKNAAV